MASERDRRPKLDGVRGMALRRRYLILTMAACGLAAWLLWYLLRVYQQDYLISVFGGYSFYGWLPTYHHSGLHLYATNPDVQIGPLALAIIGPVDKLLPGFETGRLVCAGSALLCGLVSVWAIERTAIRVGVAPRRAQLTTLLAGPVVVGAFAVIAWFAHLEDALAITLTLLAIAAISGHRPWWLPALLLGAAVLCKPWAIVALPLLLAVDEHRGRAFLAGAAVALVPWVPFIVAAPDTIHALGTLGSSTMPHSALRVLGFPVGEGAPTGIRSLEMLFGFCMAGFTVSRGRWLAVPLVAFAGRLMLEPRWFMYYGAAALAGAVLWDVTRRGFPAWTVWTVVAEFAVQQWAPAKVGAAVNLVYAVTVLAVLAFAPRQRQAVVEQQRVLVAA